jgi:hypothetical protein
MADVTRESTSMTESTATVSMSGKTAVSMRDVGKTVSNTVKVYTNKQTDKSAAESGKTARESSGLTNSDIENFKMRIVTLKFDNKLRFTFNY